MSKEHIHIFKLWGGFLVVHAQFLSCAQSATGQLHWMHSSSRLSKTLSRSAELIRLFTCHRTYCLNTTYYIVCSVEAVGSVASEQPNQFSWPWQGFGQSAWWMHPVQLSCCTLCTGKKLRMNNQESPPQFEYMNMFFWHLPNEMRLAKYTSRELLET